jgi:hypothetical protein
MGKQHERFLRLKNWLTLPFQIRAWERGQCQAGSMGILNILPPFPEYTPSGLSRSSPMGQLMVLRPRHLWQWHSTDKLKITKVRCSSFCQLI